MDAIPRRRNAAPFSRWRNGVKNICQLKNLAQYSQQTDKRANAHFYNRCKKISHHNTKSMSKEVKGATHQKAVETPTIVETPTVETPTVVELTSEKLEALKSLKAENEAKLKNERDAAKLAYTLNPENDELFDIASKCNIAFKTGDVATQKLIDAEIAFLNNEKRNAEIAALRNAKAAKFYIDIDTFIYLSDAADEAQGKLTEARENDETSELTIGYLVGAANEAMNVYKAHCEKMLNEYVFGSVKPIAPIREKKDGAPSTAKDGSISADIISTYENARRGGASHKDAKGACKTVTSNTGQIWNVINAHYESSKGANDGNAIAEATTF